MKLFWILFVIHVLILCLHVNAADSDTEHDGDIKRVPKVKTFGVSHLFRQLRIHNITELNQLTPFTYILDYKDPKPKAGLRQTITKIRRLFKHKDKTVCVKDLRLISVNLWDDIAFGKWFLQVKIKSSAGSIRVTRLSRRLHGSSKSIAEYLQYYSIYCSQNERESTDGLKWTNTKSQTSEFVINKENSFDIDGITPYLPLSLSILFMIVLALVAFTSFKYSNTKKDVTFYTRID